MQHNCDSKLISSVFRRTCSILGVHISAVYINYLVVRGEIKQDIIYNVDIIKTAS